MAGYNTAATFYPGGDDSYYMPEIVQPAPHRINELPPNVQQSVENMEQVARDRDPRYSTQSNTGYYNSETSWDRDRNAYASQQSAIPNNPPPQYQYKQEPPPPPPPVHQQQFRQSPVSQPYQQPQYSTGLPDHPNFSPFPAIRNPPPNIPPTDDQKEATLEAARDAVLRSNDPETQLIWAQDALAYVEIAQQNEKRISATQPPRSHTPRIEHALKEDAMKIVNFLADQHHPKAEFLRGMWLEFGKFGHRVDKKEAYHCYNRASERGYARADYRIGMQFESSNDALKAVKFYQKGVDAGDSASCYRLGMMTLLGQHGQLLDFNRGLDLIYSSAKSADENAPQGAYVLGMLQAGEMPQISIPESYLQKDVEAAKINIEKAAYLGFAKAQVKMGSAYELCELGCPFDPALSLHYNALAARQGEADAEMAISKWFLCGHDGVFEKNEEMAFTYAQRAAVGGLATAQFAMGYFYEVGIYVPVDFNMAKDWYRKAAQNGNPDAEGRVEAISRSKTLSRKDHERVALKRIRAQYGSAAEDAPPLPAQPGNPSSPSVEFPDPAKLNLNSTPARPSTTAPYPTGPGPEFRPTSAFGINPNLRSSSAAPMNVSRPSPSPIPAPSRPYSHQEAAPRYYGQDGRSASYGLPSQPRPPMRPNTTSPYLPQYEQRQTGPPVPTKVNIGYTAPPDPHGADRPIRPSYGVDPRGGKPQPPVPPKSNNPSKVSTRPTGQAPPSGPTTGSSSRPVGYSHGPRPQPSKQQINPPIKALPQSKPQAAQTAPSKSSYNVSASASKPVKPNTVAPSAASRPPGKGPQSFEEMGIPRVKDKGDCIVM